ncbi:guanine nucleotide-binding protein-like 1 [Teleopsis dalmanni]|uniref:guanine nucleotide-binding protein-like 1 n=1 Tax=Teleopsis dalmanni TaxID=139649 RepID=UPI0018CFD0CB|nr:guanine nucleotide-binding protein-like 1 [Teleopsis dalmanni]
MPQNQRKVPYSGKKKKDQLIKKRRAKMSQKFLNGASDGETTEDNELTSGKLMEQPLNRGGRHKNVNRYNLQFYQESKKELEQMKVEGYNQLDGVKPKMREMDAHYFDGYDFPIRPNWSYDMDKNILNLNENRYFKEYVENLQKFHKEGNNELSLFELNLETWRQLWRVLEFSDILLIIVDVRYASLMFPPSLYNYIVQTLKKHAILVLNKVDLVEPDVVVAWRHYFLEKYPQLPVVLFASYSNTSMKGSARRSVCYKLCMEGVYNIYKECQKIVNSELDLTSWEQKIEEDMDTGNLIDDKMIVQTIETTEEISDDSVSKPYQKFSNGKLTVGCIGFPNVGKSSLINALKGKKVVSVSRTPGHTKHFQTIYLTNVVVLCDCPGLVFPSATPKHLQVLLGSYPISQLQVPYRSLKFLGEHLHIPNLLKLHLPEDFDVWSPAALADAWALKRGFLTAKAARPDRYRAANHLLRMCLAGQNNIILQFYPPGYNDAKDFWQQHAEVEKVKRYQNIPIEDEHLMSNNEDTSSINSESGESEETTSSNDETNADEEDEEMPHASTSKRSNAFALLDQD